MKTQIRIAIISVFVIALQSCGGSRAISTIRPESNENYEVLYLFEYDGCKVYKFYDCGNCVYFTNCAGEITAIKSDTTETRTMNIIRKN